MNKQNLIELTEHIYAYELTGDLWKCAEICGEIVDILRNELQHDPEWDSDVTDAGIRYLWRRFGDIAIDENECIDSDFYIWCEGTPREEIWRWLDARYSKGVAHLMGIAG